MDNMYNWLQFQYFYLYFSFVCSAIVYYVYTNMNSKAETKLDETQKKKQNAMDASQAKNDNEQ